MNTKKLFMLLAAMLLGSASAMAQSGNSEPLKGDVNEDGTVDVADITAVIKIMKDGGGTGEETKYYWYYGSNPSDSYINEDNFKTIPGITQVTSYPQVVSFRTGDEEEHIYIVAKADKEVSVEVPDGITMFIYDSSKDQYVYNNHGANVDGYSIYRSLSPLTCEVEVYIEGSSDGSPCLWYCGGNKSESYINKDNYNTIEGITQVSTYPESTILKLNDEYLYIIVKADMDFVDVSSSGGGLANFNTWNPATKSFTVAFTTTSDGYAIYRSRGKFERTKVSIHISEKEEQ